MEEVMSRTTAVAALRAHANRAEENSYLRRDLIIASDLLSEADREIKGLIAERNQLRAAMENADFMRSSIRPLPKQT
jgi:hypothetical protein